jgi:transposase, IS5 family
MLRDRYAPVDLFALAPALTLTFEPVLARLDVLLDDDVLFRAVRDDLARRYPRTRMTGRPSTPVEVLLRMLIVRRLYGWSYAETEQFVGVAGVRDAFRTRTRSARRQLQRIHRLARRQGDAVEAARRAAYARLCQVARTVVRQAERIRAALVPASAEQPDPLPAAERLVGELDRLLPLARRVIDQAERRVLRGEAVPATDKVVSLVEPHTAVIPRHKAGQRVEFGRKLWLAEVDGGIIADVDVLDGAPPDAPRVMPSVERHRRQFGRPPDLLTGDRGCSTAAVRRDATQAGVRRVALPQIGPPTTASRARERERWFRRGYRWRSGIEGRIGLLRRVYGFDRCPEHGSDGVKRWVGLGVLTANLVTIARATAA